MGGYGMGAAGGGYSRPGHLAQYSAADMALGASSSSSADASGASASAAGTAAAGGKDYSKEWEDYYRRDPKGAVAAGYAPSAALKAEVEAKASGSGASSTATTTTSAAAGGASQDYSKQVSVLRFLLFADRCSLFGSLHATFFLFSQPAVSCRSCEP